MPGFHPLCRVEEIAEGTGRIFVVGQQRIGLFRINRQFYALQNDCPHAGASLAHGDVQGETVTCRIHHWRFRIPDGRYLGEDSPRCGEDNRRCDVPTFRTQVVDGIVHVEL